VWDASALIRTHRSTIGDWLYAQGADWLLNVISIRERKSYFLAGPLVSQQKLSHLLSIEWQAGIAVLDRALLRKELLKLGLANTQ
jgi:inorganic pyrophosphatase/manganese-dependent inorganic pyrophosphatase